MPVNQAGSDTPYSAKSSRIDRRSGSGMRSNVTPAAVFLASSVSPARARTRAEAAPANSQSSVGNFFDACWMRFRSMRLLFSLSSQITSNCNERLAAFLAESGTSWIRCLSSDRTLQESVAISISRSHYARIYVRLRELLPSYDVDPLPGRQCLPPSD